MVLRRSTRRKCIIGIETPAAYIDCLHTLPGGTDALRHNLLMSATAFFRDPESFAALEGQLLELVRNKGPGDAVRVWVMACATGEEVYSIAILLSEHLRRIHAPPLLQIVATDVEPKVLRTAGEGLYPAALQAVVSEDRLQRFFVREKQGFRVRPELRAMVTFAVHDVLKDAPFPRIDLISCRNLPMDLHREAPTRLLEVCHASLVANGLLFLGASEVPLHGRPDFRAVDQKHCLYAKSASLASPGGAEGRPMAQAPAPSASPSAAATPVVRGRAPGAPPLSRSRIWPLDADRSGSWGEVHLSLLEQLGPPSILIDAAYDMVHLSRSASRYLTHRAGEPSRNLLELMPQAPRVELRAALLTASTTGQPVETGVVGVGNDDKEGSDPFKMCVVPVRQGPTQLYLVLFDAPSRQASTIALQPAADDLAARELDRELERLNTHLRETAAQHELSTQDLKISNGELQAINEELRSAAEGLETSREELQSINQELVAVNLELKAKFDELGQANSDMQNLMNARAIATIFLDRELRITRYTPMAVTLFNLIRDDVGRPLTDLTAQLQYAELASDAARVLRQLMPVEREVGMADGSWFLARLLPYRTMDDRIAGVVLSFVDITERKRAEEVSQWLSAVVASSRDAIISFSPLGTILSWNGGATRVFGYAADEMIGQSLSVLAAGEHGDRNEGMLGRIGEMLNIENIENLETLGRAKDGGTIHLAVTASPITDLEGRVVGGTVSARDIGAAKRNEEALRRSEERLRLVIENARDYAIFSMDLDRIITSWNSGAEHLLGFTESEAVGRTGDMIFIPEDLAANAPVLEAHTAMSQSRAADERLHVRKNGSRFWASGTLMRMDDSNGDAIGFVKILRDETKARIARAELQRSENELLKALAAKEQARAELERADSAKDRFLAVLSHELRNPLAAVMTASELLAAPDTPAEEKARAAALVQRQARTMKSLLDDLLDVSRLAVGRFELRIRDVSLAEVVDSALEAVRTALHGAGHRLTLELPTSPVRLRVDPLRVTQVLVNLLGNAAKYTPPGGEIVLRVDAGPDEVRMAVSDNGVGIAVERIEQIFELYTQGPQAAHALNDGLGVGLSLVRTIVDLHGGTVEVTSDGPGSGSRFVVVLPTMSATPAAALSLPAARGVPVAVPRDILVADDNADAAWALARLLQRAGHRTRLARGGTEALESAFASAPDVAVLDIGMPDIDGVEVARRLRASPRTAAIVLIALTGWSGEADRARAQAAGFDALLSKPANLQELLAVMEAAASRRHA